jgi:hypothetical protein
VQRHVGKPSKLWKIQHRSSVHEGKSANAQALVKPHKVPAVIVKPSNTAEAEESDVLPAAKTL